jgi:outer membrane murein-binding lipoprotein Lpp
MSTDLSGLSAQVDTLNTQVDALITLTNTIKADLDAAVAAGDGLSTIQAISAKITAEQAKIVSAITADTPVSAPAPTTDPTPPQTPAGA